MYGRRRAGKGLAWNLDNRKAEVGKGAGRFAKRAEGEGDQLRGGFGVWILGERG